MPETGRVLDASAALAAILGEAGGAKVRQQLDDARMSAVNVAEVMTVLRRSFSVEEALILFRRLGVTVEVFDFEQALMAATLARPELIRKHNLSLGDRACLALAKHTGRPALTAERNWRIPGLGVEVQFIR
jgi:ribonuclease VapC